MSANVPKIMQHGRLTPWLYLGPSILIMLVYIVYPTLNTTYLSLRDKESVGWASTQCQAGEPCWGIFENYRVVLTDELNFSSPGELWNSFWISTYGNNLRWILLMVSGSVGFGLIMAVLSDRVKYEALAKAVIFTPMAISFVGAGIIWQFVYDFGTTNVQIGILNAVRRGLGLEPIAFLQTIPINTFALILVGIWLWTGFCMVILSAALKGVPNELLEAARMDGANEWTVFWRITIPMILPTITVVITTMVINTLKVFDIVFVMTGGNFSTDVIANRMYTEQYVNRHAGRGTAVAVILILAVLPFIYLNIKRFREQEAIR